MTQVREFRVGSWNLLDGGIDHGDDSRLRRQLQVLADKRLHALGIQEAKDWGRHQLDMAAHVLGMHPYLVPSAHDGCHLVIMVDESRVKVLEECHETGFPYWHGVACIRTLIDGVPVDLITTHKAPSSPTLRQIEAEAFRLYVKDRDVIATGDYNGVAVGDPALQVKVTKPEHRRKQITGPAEALLEAGLVDVGAHVGDLTPTVGHKDGSLAYRCDRIYTTRPGWITGFETTPTADSDHKLVRASFAVS